MAITQLNQYSTSQNIANLANNVDYNRIGEDLTYITVNFTTNVVSIKVGSMIEANGNLYVVQTADYTIGSATGVQYIHFSGTAFTLSTDKGVYDEAKGGYYDTATGLKRVLKWVVDSTNEDVLSNYNINAYTYDTTGISTGFYSETITNPTAANPYKTINFKLKKFVSIEIKITYGSGSSVGGWQLFFKSKDGTYGTLINGSNHSGTIASDNIRLINLAPGEYKIEVDTVTATGSSTMDVFIYSIYEFANGSISNTDIIEYSVV